jgi:TetR/AcrR family transcriptional regulator
MPAGERRSLILDAARAVFIEDGLSGARTKDIAERAGITESFLYRHFDSKLDMYEAAVLSPVRNALAELAADVEHIQVSNDDPIEFVSLLNRRCLRYYVEFAPLQAIAMFSELSNGREFYESAVRPQLDRMGTVIADHSGWALRGLDPVVVRRAVFGAQWVIGLDYLLSGKHTDVDTLADQLTTLFTSGIKEKAVTKPKLTRKPRKPKATVS